MDNKKMIFRGSFHLFLYTRRKSCGSRWQNSSDIKIASCSVFTQRKANQSGNQNLEQEMWPARFEINYFVSCIEMMHDLRLPMSTS
jgi:hypothetical protein